jgi:3'-phosphoadenosine 5'-phosphosulfate sulfotransferase (PAPS reductase)/FAD synthetase
VKITIPKNPITGIENETILCDWSGGASSAVACALVYEQYPGNCHFRFAQTNIEHPDTYRFLFDYERRLGIKVNLLQSDKFHEPADVWERYVGLNYANGAPCSSELKRTVLQKDAKSKLVWAAVIGFDATETKRATNMKLNYPELNPLFPLIELGMKKRDVLQWLQNKGIKPPSVYHNFKNNNCLGGEDDEKGGCVQGGIGYWQKIKQIYPKKFAYMAAKEHELSAKRGSPVTILKDRTGGKNVPMFLLPNPQFPELPHLGNKKGHYKVESFECTGYCGTRDQNNE